MGFDPERLRGMSLDDLDSWIQTQASDGANAGVLEAFFRDNPHLQKESVANLEAMERNSTELLKREDSYFLDLPRAEVQPWAELLNERPTQSGLFAETPDTAASEERVCAMFEELALPLMRQMAEAIFTQDRIQQLIAELKKYRNDRFAAGDKSAAEHAMGAMNYLKREDSPGQNSFLLTLCWRSLGSAIQAASAGDLQPAE